MKAGDKVIWTSQVGEKFECSIMAIFVIEDAVNKSMIGEKVYRLSCDGNTFHALEDAVKSI